MKACADVQSKHIVSEQLLENIWRRSSAADKPFSDWRRMSQTNLGVFSSDRVFFWANWVLTNRGLSYVFDPSIIGEPIEWRTINLEEKLTSSDAPNTIASRLSGLAARLQQLKQRRG